MMGKLYYRRPLRLGLPLLASLVLLVVAFSAVCGGSAAFGKWYVGPVLQINLVEMYRVQEVRYQEDDGKLYSITPSSPENELVVLHARVRNHAATKALVNVDVEPPELRGEENYKALNTLDMHVPVDVGGENLNRYIPFIRGSQEVPKENELNGWLVFDTPKGTKFRELRWAAGDIIFVTF